VNRRSPVASRRQGGRRTIVAVGSLGALALLLGGCGIGAHALETAAPSVAASAVLSATLAQARTQVASAISAAGFQVQDAQVPYRPPESPSVAAAPRTVIQAILPAAPDGGFVVLYAFADPAAAAAAAQELAAYIGTGPGRVQFPTDARFVIRQIGAAVAFDTWSPAGSADPDSEERLATVVGSVGTAYDVPR